MTFLYFNPDVWGTVSDWFMVIVTTTTAYYLYKTLESQKDVQKIQNKLFEIENLQFKESVKPLFNYIESKETFLIDEKYFNIISIEITNESNSSAQEIKINHNETNNIKRIMIPMDYLPFPSKFLKNGDKPYLLHFLVVVKPKAVEFITFEVLYKDISGTKYKQNIFCIYDTTLSIVKGQPEMYE